MPFLFGSTIFLSAFLLFSIQPMFAKLMLPWFGGSAAVWTTCLVFYQTALLAGYAYASWNARSITAAKRGLLHACALGLAATFMVMAYGNWPSHPVILGGPVLQIVVTLISVLGLPYLLLSSTSPLLQSWYRGKNTYRLFALSNAGALMALVAYPIWIERHFSVPAQLSLWKDGFVLFAMLCAIAASRSPKDDATARPITSTPVQFEWIALSAAGSMLLLATTNQLTQNVAPVPMLWVLPLALYLITFIIAFESSRWYRRDLSLRLLAIALASIAYAIADIQLSDALIVSIPLYCGGLFLGCLFCHGELHRLKPDPSQLTTFYLMIALGGALGAIFVGLIAPAIFSGVYELPIAMFAVAALALWLNRDRGWAQRALWAAVTVAMLAVVVQQVRAYHRNTIEIARNFYGSLRVTDSNNVRILFHGTIEHGSQFLSPDLRRIPTTYYSLSSGAGIALQALSAAGPKRVGVIGLGTGALATYGKPGDEFHYYEINPLVPDIARRQFSYLTDSAAKIEVTLGDGRLSLSAEPNQQFDALMLDAFSGDAIPVHLLTKEAFSLYCRHLKPDGLLAVHISNQYLDLAPVVGALARAQGVRAIEILNAKDESRQISEAVWILMTRETNGSDRDFLFRLGLTFPKAESRVAPVPDGKRVWTDDDNNLFEVMRWLPNQ